jgi:hypothetical protein
MTYMMTRNACTAIDMACGALCLILVLNLLSGILNPFTISTTFFCCTVLFHLKAHHLTVNIMVLLVSCVLSAVLGVLSARFRGVVFDLVLWGWSLGLAPNHFGSAIIQPIESRHIVLDNDNSATIGLALYTNYARRIIEDSQNRCNRGSSIFQAGAIPFGMGSELHFHSAVLAHAIEKKAVFAWGSASCINFGVKCREVYQDEHNCSADQINHMRVVVFSFGDWPKETVPSELLDVLPDTFTVQQALYWWRAQAIGYLMRFNSQTQEHIRLLRYDKFNFSLGGAINVNIRGGDKVSENRLIPPELYIDKALSLIEQSPLAYSRVIFITSDDPRAIARAHSYATTQRLTAIYLDVPRMKYGNDESQVASFWTYNVTISMLLQLSMASECAAWVGSRTSNWNRVVDMFRCTAAANCRGGFVEMDESIKGYYYRWPFGYD